MGKTLSLGSVFFLLTTLSLPFMPYSDYDAANAGPSPVEAAVMQCMTARWDGDVESKRERSNAESRGWIVRQSGFNLVTPEGIKMLLERGLICA